MQVLKVSAMVAQIEGIIRHMTAAQPLNITTVRANTPKLMPLTKKDLLAAQL